MEVAGTVYPGTQPVTLSESGRKKVRMHPADICQEGALDSLLAREKPELVYHLAAVSSVTSAQSNPLPAFRTNVEGTLLLLEAVRRHSEKARVVFISSSEVYGRSAFDKMPLDESCPARPATFYAGTKLSGELWSEYYHRNHGLDVVILRPFNHIGPNQSESFVTSSFARQVAEIEMGRCEPVLNVGNLEAYRDFTDVRDMVRAYLMAAGKLPSAEPMQICSGRRRKIQEILDYYLSHSHTRIEVRQDPGRMRASEVPEMWGTPQRFSSVTGWRPETPWEKTLQDILDSWRERLKANS